MKQEFTIPTAQDLEALLGAELYPLWQSLCCQIERDYNAETLWNRGGKNWDYEYKYRIGAKTLCALYAAKQTLGFMIILGKQEREMFEAKRQFFSKQTQNKFDEAVTYHDGKWIMFEPRDNSLFDDFERLLQIKRRPDRKKLL